MSFRYGYLEMKAKVPFQKGVWPAFWMITSPELNQSKYSGEIDIFEVYGSSDTLVPALHRWYREKGAAVSKDCKPDDSNEDFKVSFTFDDAVNPNEYHLYALEWTPEYLNYYVDGELYATMDISEDNDYCTHNGAHDDNMECFRQYYNICLSTDIFTDNHAGWAPDQLASRLPDFAQNGVDYKIDYIRLYQNEDAGEDFVLY